jgi:hypothetical protein
MLTNSDIQRMSLKKERKKSLCDLLPLFFITLEFQYSWHAQKKCMNECFCLFIYFLCARQHSRNKFIFCELAFLRSFMFIFTQVSYVPNNFSFSLSHTIWYNMRARVLPSNVAAFGMPKT